MPAWLLLEIQVSSFIHNEVIGGRGRNWPELLREKDGADFLLDLAGALTRVTQFYW